MERDFLKKSVGEPSLNKRIALARQGTLGKGLSRAKPEIINSDQGSQFTKWIEMVNNNNALVSIDGKGRWMDNIQIERFWRSLKYEDVYIRHYDNMVEAKRSFDAYIDFYNSKRAHQALN